MIKEITQQYEKYKQSKQSKDPKDPKQYENEFKYLDYFLKTINGMIKDYYYQRNGWIDLHLLLEKTLELI